MPKAHDTWKVLPHGPIEKLSPNLWRVQGVLSPVHRVMAVAKRADGTLVVHNGIALEDTAMAELDAWGKVSTIVVPNGYHRLDAKIFKDRYPDAKVIAPAGSRAKVAQVVPVDGTYADAAKDAVVELVHLDGTKEREGAMIVRAPGDTTVVFNDAVFNMPHGKGFTGFILRRLTASSGGPTVSRISRWLVVADKAAFRAHLERLAELPDLKRVIVSHYETISDDAAGTLRRVAATL